MYLKNKKHQSYYNFSLLNLNNYDYLHNYNFFKSYNLYNYFFKKFNIIVINNFKFNFNYFFKISKNNLFIFDNFFKNNFFYNNNNLTFFSSKTKNVFKKFKKFKNVFSKKNNFYFLNRFVFFKTFYFLNNFFFLNFFFLFNFFYLNVINYFFKNNLNKNFYKIIFNNFYLFKFINNKFIFNYNNNYFDLYRFNLSVFNNNFIYNNQFPLFFLKNCNNFLKKFSIKKKYNFINFINIKILNFLEFFFENNFFIKINTDKNQDANNILFLYKKYNNNFFKLNRNILFNEFLYIIYISFFNKDLIFLKNWIKNFFYNLELQFHKRFFNIFNEIINDNFNYFKDLFKIKGFYCCVKGKIGLTGNSKKKVFLIKRGKLNTSSKKIKIDNQKFFLKTDSGVIGLNIMLSYK